MTVPFNGFYRIGAGYRMIPVCSECGDDILIAYSMIDNDPVCAVCLMPEAPPVLRDTIRALQQRSRHEMPGLLSLQIVAPVAKTKRSRAATSA